MKLMQQFVLPSDEIYRRSFATVDALLPTGIRSLEDRHIIRCIIQTTGDPQLAPAVRFKAESISAGIASFHRLSLSLYRCPHG